METLNLSLFSLLVFGFLFGLQHSFDPDHLAAVTILNTKRKDSKTVWKSGIFWGIGHTITLLFIGILVIVFHIPVSETLSSFSELLVAFILIGLGIFTFVDFGIHYHPPLGLHKHPYPSFLIGMIHGLAGSAALMVLIISTIHSALLGLLYILIFGLGSILGMGLTGAAFGLATQFFKKYLTFAVSLFSIGSGFLLLLKN